MREREREVVECRAESPFRCQSTLFASIQRSGNELERPRRRPPDPVHFKNIARCTVYSASHTDAYSNEFRSNTDTHTNTDNPRAAIPNEQAKPTSDQYVSRSFRLHNSQTHVCFSAYTQYSSMLCAIINF